MTRPTSTTRVRSGSLIVFLATLWLASAAAAQTAPGVYYDYAQLSLGGPTQFVLVPRETTAFAPGGPPQLTIPAAFRVLHDNKRATYGSASVTLSDADLAAGRVVVHLDPSQLQYSQIVVAETVYTFTGLGVREVQFPALDGAVYGRADVPFSAFVLHVPLWRALPPARADGALIELPDGSQLAADDFYTRWESGDAALQAHLLEYLEGTEPLARRSVLQMLPEIRLSGAYEAAVGVLADPDPALRLLAVQYLAGTGEPRALEQLATLLGSESDPGVQAAISQALGSSGDAQFEYIELAHALESALPTQLPTALANLAATGDRRAAEAVVPYLAHDNTSVRDAAIEAMLSLDSPGRLADTLADQALAATTRTAVANRLASAEDGPIRVRALEYLVASQDGPSAVNALYSLRSSTAEAEAMAAIEGQLGHPSAEIRIEVARLLAQLGNADTLAVLGEAINVEADPAVRDQLDQSAMDLLTAMPRSEVASLADGSNGFLKRAAFRALGQLAQQGQGGQEVFRTLQQGLEDGEAGIRGAAVLGLGSYGNAEAFAAIAPLADDSSSDVRRDVARALVHFEGGQGVDLLRGFLSDSDEQVKAAALTTLGARRETDFLPEVLQATQSRDEGVRAAALVAASHLATPEVEQTVIDTLMGSTNAPQAGVRAAAARALANINNDLAILGIAPLTQDREMSVRLAAVEALGGTSGASARGVLTSLLRDRATEIRLAAYAALGEMGDPSAAREMEAALASENDATVAEAGRRALERLGSH